MPSLTAKSQALVQNDRPSVQDSRNVLSEEFHGPGFRFVRSFLLVILALVGCLLVLAGILSWYFSMDMTVEGKGVIEPRHRHRVKAEIAGIIQQIHVRQGQQVEKGQPLVALDDTDWRIQLQKAEKDLEVNQSQQRAIQQQMAKERNIRQAEVAHAQREVERSLASIRTVQALGLELTFYEKLRNLFMRVSELQLKSSLFENGTGFLSSVFRTTGTLAYGWYGWTQILQGNLSLGTFLAFSGYVSYLYGPIENLIGLLPQFESTLVHTNRFFELYNLKPDIQDRPDWPAPHNVQGEIGFHDVSFSYDDQAWVLLQINLTIPAHATVALVGRSGSGKSTLVKLIPRFYDPNEGYVSIDGMDIRKYRLKSLRHQVGFAMQGSIMFQGSILENLTFGRDIPLSDIEDAARVAYIHDFVASLPEGYQTEIGEQGTGLSEGQKQRLALARVLLLDTPVLILDEPTAALDLESEFYVQEALKTIRQGRTTIVIAHRLSTIQSADQIVVLEHSRVAEQGTHNELIIQSGVYAGLNERTASI